MGLGPQICWDALRDLARTFGWRCRSSTSRQPRADGVGGRYRSLVGHDHSLALAADFTRVPLSGRPSAWPQEDRPVPSPLAAKPSCGRSESVRMSMLLSL